MGRWVLLVLGLVLLGVVLLGCVSVWFFVAGFQWWWSSCWILFWP
jgi:hypothetical protein